MFASSLAKIAAGTIVLGLPALAMAKDPETQTNRKGETLICRKITLTTSRMPKKVCKTEAEWKLTLDEDDLKKDK